MPAGETWKVDGLVEASSNVVVHGSLVMSPGATLRFVGVDEAAFAGGDTHDPLESDVGLWIMEGGKLEAEGTPKLAWARTTSGLAADATRLTLDADPEGWRVGDELLITATLPPSDPTFTTANDVVTIGAISGRTVSLKSGLAYAHPAARVSPGKLMTPEVCNLTRDVRIEGTRTGRSHVFVHSDRTNPQDIRNVQFRHMGPQTDGAGVVGRYALHFHMNDDFSRGTRVEGCVARDIGTWAFVNHRSHGITNRDCIAYNVFERAFGWDLNFVSNNPDKPDFTSDDITYKRCVAVHIQDPDHDRAHAFSMQLGAGNKSVGCVAVGQQAGQHGSGFSWPEKNGGDWVFDDNVAHNNSSDGLFFWVNLLDGEVTLPMNGFIGYRNGKHGVELGAYGVNYEFNDFLLYGNGLAQVVEHAMAKNMPQGIVWRRCRFEAETPTQKGFVTDRHRVVLNTPRIIDSTIKVLSGSCLILGASGDPDRLDVVNTALHGPNELWMKSDVATESLVRIQIDDNTNPNLLDGTVAAIPAAADDGTLVPEWNARRVNIAPFHS